MTNNLTYKVDRSNVCQPVTKFEILLWDPLYFSVHLPENVAIAELITNSTSFILSDFCPWLFWILFYSFVQNHKLMLESIFDSLKIPYIRII